MGKGEEMAHALGKLAYQLKPLAYVVIINFFHRLFLSLILPFPFVLHTVVLQVPMTKTKRLRPVLMRSRMTNPLNLAYVRTRFVLFVFLQYFPWLSLILFAALTRFASSTLV
jgi:hypothetical protein